MPPASATLARTPALAACRTLSAEATARSARCNSASGPAERRSCSAVFTAVDIVPSWEFVMRPPVPAPLTSVALQNNGPRRQGNWCRTGPQLAARQRLEEAAAGCAAPGGGGDALGERGGVGRRFPCRRLGCLEIVHHVDDLDRRLLARAAECLIAVQQQPRRFVALLQKRPQRTPVRRIAGQRLGDDVIAGGFDDGDGRLGGQVVGIVRLEAGQRLEGGEHAQAILVGTAKPVGIVGPERRQRRRLVGSAAQPGRARRLVTRQRVTVRPCCRAHVPRWPPLLPDCAAILGKAAARVHVAMRRICIRAGRSRVRRGNPGVDLNRAARIGSGQNRNKSSREK